HIGDRVDVVALTGGVERAHQIKPSDLPTVTAERVRLRGIDLATLTPAIQGELGVRSTAGAALLDVPEETTRLTGLTAGDVIVRLDYRDNRNQLFQVPIAAARDLQQALDRVPRGAPFA